ncbi:class I SAM-dependent DNA methyltransferase [Chryseobacterium sp. c4a]|uniref:class I SAM-dependent DNA methyltransferase n=1 Tax=Chryseobacterium sp. c4a TaxID=1573582 RepID=UPI00135A5691|nr:class I SAM-dependent methyltransferase [Chryseobacterium sp. c4a]
MEDRLYQDTELVQFYDYDNPGTEDYKRYSRWIKKAESILDIGCGTGTLAVTMVQKGKKVTATDFAKEMLEAARKKSDKVTWIQADARLLNIPEKFDLIILTGHAFQVFLTDEDRENVFQTIKNHLNDEGIFVFDSRNPLVKDWKTWTEKESTRFFTHPQHGTIKAWNAWEGNSTTLTYHTFYESKAKGKLWQANSVISFPTKENISYLLEKVGLKIKTVYGDWEFNTYHPDSEEMIFVGSISS